MGWISYKPIGVKRSRGDGSIDSFQMVRPTLTPLIILKTMNTNKAITGLIACLLLFAIIPVECEAVQFKSRLMKKKEANGTKYLKSSAELQLHIDDLASVFAGVIEQAADQVAASTIVS
jgi:hypothetical protein